MASGLWGRDTTVLLPHLILSTALKGMYPYFKIKQLRHGAVKEIAKDFTSNIQEGQDMNSDNFGSIIRVTQP